MRDERFRGGLRRCARFPRGRGRAALPVRGLLKGQGGLAKATSCRAPAKPPPRPDIPEGPNGESRRNPRICFRPPWIGCCARIRLWSGMVSLGRCPVRRTALPPAAPRCANARFVLCAALRMHSLNSAGQTARTAVIRCAPPAPRDSCCLDVPGGIGNSLDGGPPEKDFRGDGKPPPLQNGNPLGEPPAALKFLGYRYDAPSADEPRDFQRSLLPKSIPEVSGHSGDSLGETPAHGCLGLGAAGARRGSAASADAIIQSKERNFSCDRILRRWTIWARRRVRPYWSG